MLILHTSTLNLQEYTTRYPLILLSIDIEMILIV